MSSSKIITRVFGGLGNQLFCYAAARGMALSNNAELVIDAVSGFERDHAYRRCYQLDHFSIPCRKATPAERLEPFSRIRRLMSRKWNQLLPFERRTYIQQIGMDVDPRLRHLRIQGTVHLEGYWQSEDYFKDAEVTIRRDLRIEPPGDETNLAMAASIRRSRAVAVHVRFFDEPQAETVNNAPCDYYVRAIERMDSLAPGAHYFVFSDQPAAARARLPIEDSRITLVAHNETDKRAYADMWLMTQCQHFIIANSTFSWWGAWLATGVDKHVIAPGFETRGGKMHWGFKGLLPKEWIKL